jgi:hypothetical protein
MKFWYGKSRNRKGNGILKFMTATAHLHDNLATTIGEALTSTKGIPAFIKAACTDALNSTLRPIDPDAQQKKIADIASGIKNMPKFDVANIHHDTSFSPTATKGKAPDSGITLA